MHMHSERKRKGADASESVIFGWVSKPVNSSKSPFRRFNSTTILSGPYMGKRK